MRRIESLWMYGLMATLVAAGCASNDGEGTQSAGKTAQTADQQDADSNSEATSEPQHSPDAPQAVEALTTLGAQLRRDGNGSVIEVNFRETEVTDDDLQHLVGLPALRYLKLTDTGIGDAGLEAIGKATTLQLLDLRGCPVSNAGMEQLKSLAALRVLQLSGQSGATTVDDDGMAPLGELTRLEVLALDSLWVSEVGLAALEKCQSLRELYLAHTLVGDDAAAVIAKFPKLEKLRVSQTQISSAGLEHLAQIESLRELDLSENSQIFDDGMTHVGKMTGLTRLNLWRVAITDEGVSHLQGLTNLTWLNLDNTLLSDPGVVHLSGMTKLTFLHLGSTSISDAGLEPLAALKSLKDLKVTRTAVTEEGVKSLQEKLPDTQIQLKYLGGDESP